MAADTLPPPRVATVISRVSSDAIRAAIPAEQLPYALLPGPETGGAHCWSQLDARTFSVRSATYLRDHRKDKAAESFFDLMNADIFLSQDKIGNVSARRDSFLRRARDAGDTRYYLVILYVTPAAPYIHLSFYFAVNDERLAANPNVAKLWAEFTSTGEAGDSFRNERWKVIPRVAEGAFLVKSAVGQKPALLAQKLTHTWVICDAGATAASAAAGVTGGGVPAVATGCGVESADTGCDAGLGGTHAARARGGSIVHLTGPGPYLEADCDVASSSMAYMLVSLLQQYAKHLVIDLAFAIEPRAEDELPEAILGAVRLSRIDVTRPPQVSAHPEDMVLGAPGVTHGEAEVEGDDDAGDDEDDE